MRLQRWFTCLGVGTMVLGGMLVTGPSTSAQSPTPPAAQTAAQTTDDDDGGNGSPVVGTPLLAPAIDLVRAQEIALEGQTGAAVMGLELNGDDGVLVYSVLLSSGREAEINATSGEVVKIEEDGEGDEDHDEDDGDDDKEDNGGSEHENDDDDDDRNGEDED
jgi:hypothetical protein